MKIKDYDLKKSAKRLIWRFNLKNGFTPNNEDKSALNCVLEWINHQKELVVKDKAVELLTKMYIYQLRQTMSYYGSLTPNKIVQHDIHALLDTPLSVVFEDFARTLRSNQISYIAELSKEKPMGVEHLNRVYNDEVIETELNHMITEVLNRF